MRIWYDYVKPKHGKNQNCAIWMHFIVYIETDDIYEDIAEDVETGCDASNMN